MGGASSMHGMRNGYKFCLENLNGTGCLKSYVLGGGGIMIIKLELKINLVGCCGLDSF